MNFSFEQVPEQEADQSLSLWFDSMSWPWGWEAVCQAACLALSVPSAERATWGRGRCPNRTRPPACRSGSRWLEYRGCTIHCESAPLCPTPHPAKLGRAFSPPWSPWQPRSGASLRQAPGSRGETRTRRLLQRFLCWGPHTDSKQWSLRRWIQGNRAETTWSLITAKFQHEIGKITDWAFLLIILWAIGHYYVMKYYKRDVSASISIDKLII